MELEKLGLTPRVYNALRRAHIDTVEKLKEIPTEELRQIKDIGALAQSEIEFCLRKQDNTLGVEETSLNMLDKPKRVWLKLEDINLDFFELVISPETMSADLRFAINGTKATACFPLNTSKLSKISEKIQESRGLRP